MSTPNRLIHIGHMGTYFSLTGLVFDWHDMEHRVSDEANCVEVSIGNVYKVLHMMVEDNECKAVEIPCSTIRTFSKDTTWSGKG